MTLKFLGHGHTEAADRAPTPERKSDMQEGQRCSDREKIAREGLRALIWVGFAGLVALAFYASRCNGWKDDLSVAGAGIVVAGAALLIGGVLGFLFGIPRTVAAEPHIEPKTNGDENKQSIAQRESREASDASQSYRPNTDLEQIADWLTKILVGVGLTQLTSIPEKMSRLGTSLAPGLGGNATFAEGLSVYFVLCGFLFGFIWTRLYMPIVLRWSDEFGGETRARVKATEQGLAALAEETQVRVKETGLALTEASDKQKDDDEAKALSLKQLSPNSGLPAPIENILKDKIKNAREAARDIIFQWAAKFRSDNWKNKTAARTVPIFKALIESSPENPEYHGQLGCALKDLAEKPDDYRKALHELDTAVTKYEQLKKGEEAVWYKFQRAVCRINLDDKFKSQGVSDETTKKLIAADLEVAWENDQTKQAMLKEVGPSKRLIVMDWITKNSLEGQFDFTNEDLNPATVPSAPPAHEEESVGV